MASRRRRWPRAAFLLLPVATLALPWMVGLVLFARAIPSEATAPARPTDAIVVLTGGSMRLEKGLALLAQGKAKKLFVSGVHRGVEVQELLAMSRRTPEALDCCIVLGYSADDTFGNAVETAAWMEEQGYRSLRLVTASYHMPRSLLEFRAAMPKIEMLPDPVFPDHVKLEGWWRWPGTARLIVGEYNKYLVALIRRPLWGSHSAAGLP